MKRKSGIAFLLTIFMTAALCSFSASAVREGWVAETDEYGARENILYLKDTLSCDSDKLNNILKTVYGAGLYTVYNGSTSLKDDTLLFSLDAVYTVKKGAVNPQTKGQFRVKLFYEATVFFEIPSDVKEADCTVSINGISCDNGSVVQLLSDNDAEDIFTFKIRKPEGYTVSLKTGDSDEAAMLTAEEGYCTYENDFGKTKSTDFTIIFTPEPVLPHEHTESEWLTEKEPTCADEGLKYKICTDCKEIIETDVIGATGEHKYESKATAAKCTSKGFTTHKCKSCGYTRTDSYINATGHSFTYYKSNGDATCTADGTKTAVCDRCTVTDTKKQTGSAKGHRYTSKITAEPTCTLAGTKTYSCSVCGSKYTEAVKALGHSYSASYTTDKKATYKTSGEKSKHCTRKGCKAKTSVTTVARLTLSKVTGLKASTATTTLKAQWKKVKGAEAYRVQLLSSKGKVIKSFITKKTSYTFKKLSSSTIYKVRVRAIAGNNEGKYSSVLTVSTSPAPVKLSSLKSVKAKTADIKWKAVSGVSGYEVQYSTSKKFKSAKAKKIKKGKTVKLTVKKLKSKKTYYVRVRAYKTVNGKSLYGEWSQVEGVKIK